jgi:hypothetical protein|nr:MAG TPA: hypothetical protein [Caudoviricetes sp.]
MSYIINLINSGKIVASAEAEEELTSELSPGEQQLVNEGGAEEDDNIPTPPPSGDEGTTEGEEPLPHEETIEETPEEPKEENVKKIYTLEVLSKVMAKYDQYMAETNIDWAQYINKGRVKKSPCFIYLEDMHTLINNTLDDSQFEFVKIYNQLYEFMTEDKTASLLAVYGRESYSKPYIAEGLALLLYELTIDWAIFMTRYYKEMPDLKDEQDSFFKKFPNLRFLSYISYLIVNAKEFNELISKDTVRELVTNETTYKLGLEVNKKNKNPKSLYKLAGENFSYFASLIRHDYADITCGVIANLGVVAFLNNKTAMEMSNRLSLITALIRGISAKNPVQVDQNNQTISTLSTVDMQATELLKNRSEAKILLDANEKQYPLAVVE